MRFSDKPGVTVYHLVLVACVHNEEMPTIQVSGLGLAVPVYPRGREYPLGVKQACNLGGTIKTSH